MRARSRVAHKHTTSFPSLGNMEQFLPLALQLMDKGVIPCIKHDVCVVWCLCVFVSLCLCVSLCVCVCVCVCCASVYAGMCVLQDGKQGYLYLSSLKEIIVRSASEPSKNACLDKQVDKVIVGRIIVGMISNV